MSQTFSAPFSQATQQRIASFLACILIAGCTLSAARIESLADSAHLQRYLIESNHLRSLVYLRNAPGNDGRLTVFFEGDGVPWRGGIEPSSDPTTREPIALELMLRTPGAAAYVARPCYQGVQSERCTPELWTGARYSEEIVRAMSAAVSDALLKTHANELVLIGYSGGGVLAVLIAERLERVSGVVTIAANLDIDKWTTHHAYLPLSQSLNPARSERDHPWTEIHLEGVKDTVVPASTRDSYFQNYSTARRWVLDQHGHKCCWVQEWEQLWVRISEELKK